MPVRILLILVLLVPALRVLAEDTAGIDDENIESVITELDPIYILPELCPLIFKNRASIGLTQDQLAELQKWHDTYTLPMAATQKQIASKRIEIREAALTPSVSSARLIQMQKDIFRLQRQYLEYNLSCRENILRTFNDVNWINLSIVLAGSHNKTAAHLNKVRSDVVVEYRVNKYGFESWRD